MGGIVLDSSALLAVLYHESDAQAMLDAMQAAESLLLSAATYVETGVAFDRRLSPGTSDVDVLLGLVRAQIAPFTAAQAQTARHAYATFGKGRHPAKLNLGDCFAYALAKEHGAPLLFKGDDFRKTDIVAAL